MMINKLLFCQNFKLLLNNSQPLISNIAKTNTIKSNVSNIIFANLTSSSNKSLKNVKFYNIKESNHRFKSRSTENFRLINDNKILLKRVYNTGSNPIESKTPTINANTTTQAQSLSIFKRFKEAYKQHGQVLIYTHIVLCCGWIVGFYFLSTCGFDLTSLLRLLEKVHIFSRETSDSIVEKINTFRLDKFLRDNYFTYVLSDSSIEWIGEKITGVTLKHIITAIMLYKIFTPLRYVATLATTKLLITIFKNRGVIPKQPPPGSSIKDLYAEQKQVIRRGIKKQREKYKNTNVGRLIIKQRKSFNDVIVSNKAFFRKKEKQKS